MFFFLLLIMERVGGFERVPISIFGGFHLERKPYFLVLSSGFFVEFFGDEKSLEEWPDCRNGFL